MEEKNDIDISKYLKYLERKQKLYDNVDESKYQKYLERKQKLYDEYYKEQELLAQVAKSIHYRGLVSKNNKGNKS